MSARMPHLRRCGNGYSVHLNERGLPAGCVETGPNMNGWGWTVGLGWHTGLPTFGTALDALLADPAFGVDVHGEGTQAEASTSGADRG